MKRLTLSLALSLVLLLGLAAPTLAAEAPAGLCTADAMAPTTDVTDGQLLPDQPIDDALLQGKQICQYPQMLDCERRNSSYCTYSWNCDHGCCQPIWISPGAYCPWICV